jgi:hypothetical protein
MATHGEVPGAARSFVHRQRAHEHSVKLLVARPCQIAPSRAIVSSIGTPSPGSGRTITESIPASSSAIRCAGSIDPCAAAVADFSEPRPNNRATVGRTMPRARRPPAATQALSRAVRRTACTGRPASCVPWPGLFMHAPMTLALSRSCGGVLRRHGTRASDWRDGRF